MSETQSGTLLEIQPSRRDFLVSSLGTAVTLVPSLDLAADRTVLAGSLPWYQRALRWGQTNITERDATRYDIAWWRGYWKRTMVQAVIINAGGIFAYYPSRNPLHHRAEFLGDRDLFGEVAAAAREEGLVVLARMDSNRATGKFFTTHPDWFVVDAQGTPYRAGELYISCVNSPYYEEYIPEILREIIERYHPDGFADNSWSGLGRESICYCHNCSHRFREKTGNPLPSRSDWQDPQYRQWILWNYQRRLEIWDQYNRITRDAGGAECLWIGMNSGSISSQCRSFRDYAEICRRSEIVLLDHQSRSESSGFQQNADTGMLIHGLLGWDKLIPESMAMYQAGRTSFRLASKPAAEARLWMIAGFSGGIQPWWHHVGAYHEDRRMYRTVEPIHRWHRANERYLIHRQPIATVGLVWSQRNTDFYGREDAAELVENPYRGWVQALIRARIPYLPIHIDDVDRDGQQLRVLILPNLAAISERQILAVRRFVTKGGSLIATGASTLLDEWGDRRADFALADLFGAHIKGGNDLGSAAWAASLQHTYLRLAPELRFMVDGPHTSDEPKVAGHRHPVLQGFDEADILAYGGQLGELTLDAGVMVPMTFVPSFPVYPPETAWMRVPQTNIPALILNRRVAFLPADIDRRYAKDALPDHGVFLANLVQWAAADSIPLRVQGPGLIDCRLYRQEQRIILHLVNLTNAAGGRGPIEEWIPVGPLQVQVKMPSGYRGRKVRYLVSGERPSPAWEKGWLHCTVNRLMDHEVIVAGDLPNH